MSLSINSSQIVVVVVFFQFYVVILYLSWYPILVSLSNSGYPNSSFISIPKVFESLSGITTTSSVVYPRHRKPISLCCWTSVLPSRLLLKVERRGVEVQRRLRWGYGIEVIESGPSFVSFSETFFWYSDPKVRVSSYPCLPLTKTSPFMSCG